MMRSLLCILFAFTLTSSAQDKKDDKAKKPETGSITGVIVSKGDAWIEVKSDNEARPRRFIARWKDSSDAAKIKAAELNSRVKLDWTMIDSRPRVDSIAVTSDGGSGKKAEPEKKLDSEAPPPRLKK